MRFYWKMFSYYNLLRAVADQRNTPQRRTRQCGTAELITTLPCSPDLQRYNLAARARHRRGPSRGPRRAGTPAAQPDRNSPAPHRRHLTRTIFIKLADCSIKHSRIFTWRETQVYLTSTCRTKATEKKLMLGRFWTNDWIDRISDFRL